MKKRKARSHRLLVSPSGFDDIGAVLTDMGKAFGHEDIDWDDLEDPGALEDCEVLFINCARESGDKDYADRIAPTIQEFVKLGGSLYCSCWAVAVLEAAFPGLLTHSGDYSGTVEASVRDLGLREYLGKSHLAITLCGWWLTRVTSWFDGKVLLVGALDGDELEDDGDEEEDGDAHSGAIATSEYPLLLSFGLGKGAVIYTAFHNEEQTSTP